MKDWLCFGLEVEFGFDFISLSKLTLEEAVMTLKDLMLIGVDILRTCFQLSRLTFNHSRPNRGGELVLMTYKGRAND